MSAQNSPILHITTPEAWQLGQGAGAYRGDTLATEGFIHCSTPEQAAATANRFYAGKRGLILLRIDTASVAPEVRWEDGGGQLFPHIYGPLNLDAVTVVVPFEPGDDGRFRLPDAAR